MVDGLGERGRYIRRVEGEGVTEEREGESVAAVVLEIVTAAIIVLVMVMSVMPVPVMSMMMMMPAMAIAIARLLRHHEKHTHERPSGYLHQEKPYVLDVRRDRHPSVLEF